MKNILAIVAILVTSITFAQKERNLTFNNDTNLIDVTYYHENGAISQSGSYTVDGKLQGDWVSYDTLGNKKVVATYDNGVKVGKWFFCNKDSYKEVDYSHNIITNVAEWQDAPPLVLTDK